MTHTSVKDIKDDVQGTTSITPGTDRNMLTGQIAIVSTMLMSMMCIYSRYNGVRGCY